MNILRKYSKILNYTQRILDIGVLLFITRVFGRYFGPPELFRILAIYGSLLLFATFSFLGFYKSWRETTIINQIKSLLLPWLLVLFVFNIIILLLSNKDQFNILWPYVMLKIPLFYYWALGVFFGLVVEKIIIKMVLILIRKKGYNQRNSYIVGAGETGKKLAEYLLENKWMGIKFIGFFDDKKEKGELLTCSPNVLGSIMGHVDQCLEQAVSKNIDMVFIALPMSAEEKIRKLIWGLGTKGVNVLMVQDLFTYGIQKARKLNMGNLHLLDFNLFPGWKRTFDIIFSLIVIVLTLPLWLLIIVIIKLEDRGPVFYKHCRVMETGKSFSCLKFRTMHVDADKRLKTLLEQESEMRKEWECAYKLKNDPRVTKVGKFLRKTSIDELPQFINVIKGEMSVVGARPIVCEELEKYYNKTALIYCAMKPGITGLWQCGKRSDTVNYNERVELDRWYVLNCNIWLDIKIIFKTIWHIICLKGAY